MKQVEAESQVKDVCREVAFPMRRTTSGSPNTAHGSFRRAKLRDVEAEHAKLKGMYAELAMENHALKDLIAKKL